MTTGLSFWTFNETHPKLPGKEPLIIRQTHVHAALYGLNVFGVCCICAYKIKPLSLGFFWPVKPVSKTQPYCLNIIPMPCFSIREIRSASVRSWGGLVCPSTISIAVGWNVVSGVYNGITCTTNNVSLLEYDKNNNIYWLMTLRQTYWQHYLIVPLVVWVNVEIVTGNNRKSTCREFLFSNVNFYSHLLALCILGATGQEVTNDKLVQPFLISLYKRKIWHHTKIKSKKPWFNSTITR